MMLPLPLLLLLLGLAALPFSAADPPPPSIICQETTSNKGDRRAFILYILGLEYSKIYRLQDRLQEEWEYSSEDFTRFDIGGKTDDNIRLPVLLGKLHQRGDSAVKYLRESIADIGGIDPGSVECPQATLAPIVSTGRFLQFGKSLPSGKGLLDQYFEGNLKPKPKGGGSQG